MKETHLAIVGDVHGHLQLALAMVARWQKELAISFDAVLLCGDVGTFTGESTPDSATVRHAKTNPCELEFIRQWAADSPPEWLDYIFRPAEEHGLGLCCPVIMTYGNHDGFKHLMKLFPLEIPKETVEVADLPGVDTNKHIRLLPSAWRTRLDCGCVVAAVGGIERGQRKTKYHPMAYIDEAHVLALVEHASEVDVLITHQGPARFQEDVGSPNFDLLLDNHVGQFWFHGHSVKNREIQTGVKPAVVPLKDIAFVMKGESYDPGIHGWAYLTLGTSENKIVREVPTFWRDFRMHHWFQTQDGLLIAPDLASLPVCTRLPLQKLAK